jgi:ferredoxin
MLRKIRILLAALFFLGLTLLFLDFTGVLHHWLGWLAKVQALEAVLALNVVVIALLVLLTLVFGRIYCSVICPLGVMQDIFGWFGRKAKKNRYSFSPEMKWLRYGVLALFLVALVAGIGVVVQLLAPYSAFGRIVTMLFQPLWMLGNNALASIADSMNSYAFYEVDVWMKSLPVLITALVTFVLLFVLAWRNGRTYCNTICPVGTVLSFLARFSFLKVQIDTDKCRNCSRCAKNCKAACIDFKNHAIDYSRCVVCGDCLKNCEFDAISYVPAKSKHQKGENNAADSGKRSFLVASALLSTAALAQEAKKVDGGFADLADKVAPERQTPLTPPGSLSYANFTKRCTGCQLCVSKCPNGVLRPSSDMMHFMLPTMSYEQGFCRPECTRCSDVCPAGAIKPLDDIEKSSVQIGHAVWIKKNCIPISDGVDCGNCSRHCPTGAITMVALNEEDEETPWVPSVDVNVCIGCGACEYVCPARPFSAIYVEGHEVHKKI